MPITGEAIESAWIDRYQRLASQPNIYMKVSALLEQSTSQPAPTQIDFYRPTLDVLWQAFGPDRLIYGSNWPVLERAGSFKTSLGVVKTYFAEKGDAAWNKYFWQNAQTAYKIAISN
jgi:predicted TIM-barrel fold metal-dependent hydrolase